MVDGEVKYLCQLYGNGTPDISYGTPGPSLNAVRHDDTLVVNAHGSSGTLATRNEHVRINALRFAWGIRSLGFSTCAQIHIYACQTGGDNNGPDRSGFAASLARMFPGAQCWGPMGNCVLDKAQGYLVRPQAGAQLLPRGQGWAGFTGDGSLQLGAPAVPFPEGISESYKPPDDDDFGGFEVVEEGQGD